MAKKSRKKKQKFSIKKIILIAVIVFIFLLLFLSSRIFNTDESNVKVGKLEFEHIGNDEYVTFNIENPSDTEKSCSFKVVTTINEYRPKYNIITIPPNSKKKIKMQIKVPFGTSDVDLIYNCE